MGLDVLLGLLNCGVFLERGEMVERDDLPRFYEHSDVHNATSTTLADDPPIEHPFANVVNSPSL